MPVSGWSSRRITKEKACFYSKGDSGAQDQPYPFYYPSDTVQLGDLSAGFTAHRQKKRFQVLLPWAEAVISAMSCVLSLPVWESGEYFDVLPYEAAGEYLMNFIKAPKNARKLKVGFSNSPANLTHATYRDLGFAANKNELPFDVYSAEDWNNPRLGIRVKRICSAIKDSFYYIKAMWLTFCAYGNYETVQSKNPLHAGFSGWRWKLKAYLEKLMRFCFRRGSGYYYRFLISKQWTAHSKVPVQIAQKQEGLHCYLHPIGGQPSYWVFSSSCEYLVASEMRKLSFLRWKRIYCKS